MHGSMNISSVTSSLRVPARPASLSLPAQVGDLVEIGRGPQAMGPDPITPMFNALVGGAVVGGVAGGYAGFRLGSYAGFPIAGAVVGGLVGAVGVGVFAASVAVR